MSRAYQETSTEVEIINPGNGGDLDEVKKILESDYHIYDEEEFIIPPDDLIDIYSFLENEEPNIDYLNRDEGLESLYIDSHNSYYLYEDHYSTYIKGKNVSFFGSYNTMAYNDYSIRTWGHNLHETNKSYSTINGDFRYNYYNDFKSDSFERVFNGDVSNIVEGDSTVKRDGNGFYNFAGAFSGLFAGAAVILSGSAYFIANLAAYLNISASSDHASLTNVFGAVFHKSKGFFATKSFIFSNRLGANKIEAAAIKTEIAGMRSNLESMKKKLTSMDTQSYVVNNIKTANILRNDVMAKRDNIAKIRNAASSIETGGITVMM